MVGVAGTAQSKDVSVTMSEMSVNTTAGMLKLCFRELPSPSSLTSSTPTSLKASVSTGGLGVLGGISSSIAALGGCEK
ncbi:hypothetical protein AAY473_040656 [Plecturocebus cupreus]